MPKNNDKLLTEILKELKLQTLLSLFIAVSVTIISLYLVAYGVASIMLSPNYSLSNAYYPLEVGFGVFLIVLAIILIVFAVAAYILRKRYP